MSLRLQLLGTMALVLLGTLLLGAFLTYRHALNKIDTEMSASIGVGTRIAKNAVDDAEEVVNPRRRLELLVGDFDGDRHLRATFIEPSGAVAAVSQLAPPDEAAPAWLFQLLNRETLSSSVALPSVFTNVGRIELQTDSRNEIAEVWQDVQLFITILSIFCAAGVLVTLFIVGHAMRPLSSLTRAFQRIGDGDYAPRMSQTGPREVVTLAEGFNQMVAHLAATQEQNRSLLVQLETVQEEERAELARNLHDEVSPMLFCVGIDAKSIERLADDCGAPKVADYARSIQTAVTDMKGNIKGILGDLRPSRMHALGLQGAIEDLAEFWRTRHPAVRFLVDIAPATWGARIDGTLQAIIGESVSNALKHSSVSELSIAISHDERLVTLTVRDNGGGLKSGSAERGFGILGMRERAQKIGGALDVATSADGRGVAVTASIPIPPADQRRELPVHAAA
ncbi:MAG: HAMP domain-containing protein [Hyphomicrobium sp.]